MSNIKSNPYGKYNGNELDYILEVLDSENMERKSNPYVNRLEEKFSEVFQSKYSIAHNSGTSTLHSCLVAAGVNKGDEVISPAHTVIMNSFVTLYMNAIPVYVDIDPKLKVLVEDVILNRRDDATERLVDEATKFLKDQTKTIKDEEWRNLEVNQRINHSLVQGINKYIINNYRGSNAWI